MASPESLLPNPLASRKEKATDKYGLAWARFIWNNHSRLSPLVSEIQGRYRINRQFAEGLESVTDLTTLMGVENTAFMNVNIKPVNYISKIKDIIVEILMTQPSTVQCEPLDPESKLIDEDKKRKIQAAMFLKKNASDLEEVTGIPITDPSIPTFDNDDQMNLYLSLNGKGGVSLAMEEAINYVLYNNDFDYSVKKQMLTDLVVLKKTAIMVDYDEDYNITVDCPDFLDLVYPYSKTDVFANIPYVGVIKSMTIEQIAMTAKKEDGTPRYSEEELEKIAKLQAGVNGNPAWNNAWSYGYEGYYNNSTLIRPYYNFNIKVLRYWYLSNTREYLVKTKTKDGKEIYEWKSKEANPENSKNEKINVAERYKQWRYEGNWIVGTDYLFNYKESKDIPREKTRMGYSPKTMLPIHIIAPDIYDMENKSLVEKAIPAEQKLNLIEQKIQQFLITAAPAGYSINQAALEDVKIGKGNSDAMSPQGLASLFMQTGSIVHNSKDANGNPLNIQPILSLPNGFGQGFNDLLNARQLYIQAINDAMGFNEAMNASLPSNDTPVGTQQMARQATMNSMMNLYRAFVNVTERALKDVACKIQDNISENREGFIEAIGAGAVSEIEMFKVLPFSSMGIKIQIGSSEDEIRDVLNMLNLDVQNQTISTSDFLRIKKQLRQNSDAAAQLLVLLENTNRQKRMEESQAQQESNAQVQQQSLQMASQMKQQEMQLEIQAKIAMLEAEYKLKAEFEAEQHKRLMELQQAKNIGIAQVAEINAGKAVDVQSISTQGKIVESSNNNDTKIAVKHIEHEGKLKHEAYKNAITPKNN